MLRRSASLASIGSPVSSIFIAPAQSVGNLRKAELGALARNANVGQAQKIDQALAEGVATHCRHDRLEARLGHHDAFPAGIAEFVLGIAGIEVAPHGLLGIEVPARRLDVVARAEGARAGAAHDADLEDTAFLEVPQRQSQVLVHLRVGWIDLAVLEGEDGQLVVLLVVQRHQPSPWRQRFSSAS
jgi:hypothetical protein